MADAFYSTSCQEAQSKRLTKVQVPGEHRTAIEGSVGTPSSNRGCCGEHTGEQHKPHAGFRAVTTQAIQTQDHSLETQF